MNHDKLQLHDDHIEKVRNKGWAISGKEAILEMWSEIDYDKFRAKDSKAETFEEHHVYLLGLKHRIRNLRTQLGAMK